MELRDLLGYLWYQSKIIIVKKDLPIDFDDLENTALFSGANWELRSETTKYLLNKRVGSFGVIDNIVIIEVY